MVDRKYYIPVDLYPLDGKKGKTYHLWDLSFWTRVFHLLLAERVGTARRIIGELIDDDSIARKQAIEFMYEKIEEYEEEAENEPSTDKQLAHQLAFTAEGNDKNKTYLLALHRAQEYLEAMTPHIIGMHAQRILRHKKKLLAQSLSR